LLRLLLQLLLLLWWRLVLVLMVVMMLLVVWWRDLLSIRIRSRRRVAGWRHTALHLLLPLLLLLLLQRWWIALPNIHRTLIPARRQLLRVPTVDRVDTVWSDLALKSRRCLSSPVRTARRTLRAGFPSDGLLFLLLWWRLLLGRRRSLQTSRDKVEGCGRSGIHGLHSRRSSLRRVRTRVAGLLLARRFGWRGREEALDVLLWRREVLLGLRRDGLLRWVAVSSLRALRRVALRRTLLVWLLVLRRVRGLSGSDGVVLLILLRRCHGALEEILIIASSLDELLIQLCEFVCA